MKTKIQIQVNKKQILIIDICAETYFSITGILYERANIDQYNKYDIQYFDGKSYELITAGCIHEIILKYRPDLQIFVNLHLSDLYGIPIHAIENGFYFYNETMYETLKKHLRISDTELTGLINTLSYIEYYSYKKMEFSKYVYTLFPTWLNEATNAINVLKELINAENN